MAFTLIFFAVFSISERFTRKRGAAHTELDQFNLEPGEDLTPDTLGVRPGNVLIMVRDYNTLYNLGAMLDRVDTRRQDIVVLHMRLLARAASGEHELTPEQLFSGKEQELFTRALALAEKKGKTIHLAVASATEKWDGILRAAQSLRSSCIVLGLSPSRPVTDEARVAGLAWERLPNPKPQLTLEICSPNGQEHVFYLGPHAPNLTPKEIDSSTVSGLNSAMRSLLRNCIITMSFTSRWMNSKGRSETRSGRKFSRGCGSTFKKSKIGAGRTSEKPAQTVREWPVAGPSDFVTEARMNTGRILL